LNQKKISEELSKKGIELMDAPVSGGEPKAIYGTLSVMCEGKKVTFDKYYDLLMVVAGSVVYVGEIGSGNIAKLAQVDFVINGGVSGILACSSNGEFYMLEEDEMEKGLKIMIDQAAGKVPVYMGIGAISTKNV